MMVPLIGVCVFPVGILKYLSLCYFRLKIHDFGEKMGGDRVQTELGSYEEFHRDPLVWHICVEGGIAPLMECL